MLIVFQPDARPADVRAILHDLGATRIHSSRKNRVERHKIRKPVEEAVAKYRNHPAVRLIEPNYIIHAEAIPNDTSFPIQWSLRNTGQQGGTPGADIDAVTAWERTTGSNQVVVAIIDTGMDLTHPDLAANLYTNPGEVAGNGIDDDGNGFTDDVHGFDFANFDPDPSDDNGHGTHVSGTIGAAGNNGIGVAGVAWHVKLLPVKFLDASGSGTTSQAVDCVEYAVLAGASIINASWGSPEASQALELAIQAAGDAGVLFVAAAGNNSLNTDMFGSYPASFPDANVISVGASSRTDERAAFSNYGAASVDLFAPGVQILSTLPNASYGLESGTSMAAPHATGALALLKARFPTMGAATLKSILLAATDRIPALAGLSVSGGRLDAARMLEGVDSTAPGPIADLASSLVSSDRVTVNWTATGDDGATGAATEYELRYSTAPIDSAAFSAAARVPGLAAPGPAGTREVVTVGGLLPETDYSMALVVKDEFGNPSPLSNVIAFRTTAPPVVSVDPPSVEGALLTGQRRTANVIVRNDGEGVLDFRAEVRGEDGAPAPRWLSVQPSSGSALSGQQVPLAVTSNAAGIPGGDYRGRIRLSTNDPSRDSVIVPVTLHVTSAPDIDVTPSPFSFGPIVVGATDIEEMFISNLGFSDLHVASVRVEGSDFSADTTGFDLGPGDAWDLLIAATPTTTGIITGALVFTSDDPDQPTVRVSLAASGIIPPVISIAPGHQDAALQTGQTTTRTFTISNTGGSFLSWSLRARSAATLAFDSTGAQVDPPASAPASASPPNGTLSAEAIMADLSDVRIVFDSRHGASSGAWSDLIGTLTSRGAVFTLNKQRITPSVLAGADLYWVSDDAGAFDPDERAALGAWVRAGGSLLLEGSAPAALPEFEALLDSTGVPLHYEPGLGITGPTTRIYPYEITRDVEAADMPSVSRLHVDGAGADVLIEDALGYPTLAASFVARGRVLASAGRLFADVSSIFGDNRAVALQSMGWLGGAVWLSTSPASGSTGLGKSSTVTIRFDAARLAGAAYRGALVLRSNDPGHGQILLPVDLSVSPAPDAETAPARLDLGSVFLGGSRIDSVRVRNVGTFPMRVVSALLDHPDFSTPFDSTTLAPGAAAQVRVRYAPTALGSAVATLTVRTDDPDQPEIQIPIAGIGAPPPDIEVTAGSLSASLSTGGADSRTMTVANRSGSDLKFSIRFEEGTPGGATATAGGTSLPAISTSWTEAWERARASSSASAGTPALSAGSAASAGDPVNAAGLDSLPLVLVDPQGDGSVMDLVALRAWARGGVLSVLLETSSVIAPFNVGGYVSFDIDQNPNTGRDPSFGSPRQDIGAEFEVNLFSVGSGVVDLVDARTGNYVQHFPAVLGPHSIGFAIPLSWLQGDDGRINVSGVIGGFSGATDLFPNRGHGTIGGSWLAATPSGGTLPAGVELPIALTLEALSLPGGAYRGSLVVESNDPDEPSLEIPAALDVTDAPVAAASVKSLYLGSPFLGQSSGKEIVVANRGRAPLTVASAAVDSAAFTVSPSSFVVEPGATQAVHVTFTPMRAGSFAATLTFAHDAVDGPLAIPLTGDGLIAPVVQVGPSSLEATVALGERGSASLLVRNLGGSGLDFGVEPMNEAPAVTLQPGLSLPRDQEDPRPGIAPSGALGVGGPDAFGYRWVDNRQAGGPVFDWQDIAAIGTPIPIRNLDEISGPLPIGFEFPFYGREYTTLRVCTHGYISFTDTTVEYRNQPLPSAAAPNNLLAVFWDDLYFAGVERAAYYNDGTRLIIQFTNVSTPQQRAGPYTFQAILYPTGAIVYQYLLMGPPTTSSTVGIQSNKSDGLTVVFNNPYVSDGLAVRFSAAPSWLDVPQRFGRVEPGDSALVEIAFRTRGLFAGAYSGALRVQTNDPGHPETTIPVVLHATGIPRLAFSPADMRFDTLEVGGSATDTLRLTNMGTDRLEASITFEGPDFTASPAALSLAPLQSAPVAVLFGPSASGDRGTGLTIASNDPETPLARVPIVAAARSSVRLLRADLSPATLRRQSRGGALRARLLMPQDLDARQVALAGVRLQGVVPADLAATRLHDLDGDGRPDLDLAFDRAAALRALPDGDSVSVAITGAVGTLARFEARGVVRVLGKGSAAAGVEFDGDEVPAASALRASAPNPFTASTALRFDLAAGGTAALRVYTAGGRLVRTVFQAPLPAGRFRATWDGRDARGAAAPSGVYFVRLEISGAAPFQGVRRLVRVR